MKALMKSSMEKKESIDGGDGRVEGELERQGPRQSSRSRSRSEKRICYGRVSFLGLQDFCMVVVACTTKYCFVGLLGKYYSEDHCGDCGDTYCGTLLYSVM